MFYVIDSHCDSIQKTEYGESLLVNPYNFSRKHPQLQFVILAAAELLSGHSRLLRLA